MSKADTISLFLVSEKFLLSYLSCLWECTSKDYDKVRLRLCQDVVVTLTGSMILSTKIIIL